MNNLSLAFSVVFPLFCMMVLGYFLRTIKLFNEPFLKQLNRVCFQVFLPTVLFINIYQSDFQSLFSWKLVLFAVLCVTAAFLLLMLLVPLFTKENKSRGVMIQGIFRSNFILFGIPMTVSLYGPKNTSVTAILLAFVIPLYNLLSIIALALFSGTKKSVLSILKEIFSNPLIVGAAIAFFFVLTKLRLPVVVSDTISDIGKVATPLALIVLGGSFQFKSLKKYPLQLSICVLGKLVLMPLLFIPIGVLAGFRNLELAALFCMFASPTAVSTFTMAQAANANDELAGQIVVFDSLLSVITIFFGITILKSLNLI